MVGTRHWSPPRQALLWAALDVAIASALQAAWYYKWLATGRPMVARRLRPWEYAVSEGKAGQFHVLFDEAVNSTGSGSDLVVMTSEGSRAIIRSMTFSSSRTLPGQA